MGRFAAFFAAFIALLGSAGVASAHTVGVSRGTYRFEKSELVATLNFARTELALAVPELENEASDETDRIAVERFLVRGLRVSAGDERCRGPKIDLGTTA